MSIVTPRTTQQKLSLVNDTSHHLRRVFPRNCESLSGDSSVNTWGQPPSLPDSADHAIIQRSEKNVGSICRWLGITLLRLHWVVRDTGIKNASDVRHWRRAPGDSRHCIRALICVYRSYQWSVSFSLKEAASFGGSITSKVKAFSDLTLLEHLNILFQLIRSHGRRWW